MDIIAHLTKLQSSVFVNRNDDDFADRLNYRYTIAVLVTFAVIVSHRQFSQSGNVNSIRRFLLGFVGVWV